jgi:hypothetical protein
MIFVFAIELYTSFSSISTTGNARIKCPHRIDRIPSVAVRNPLQILAFRKGKQGFMFHYFYLGYIISRYCWEQVENQKTNMPPKKVRPPFALESYGTNSVFRTIKSF